MAINEEHRQLDIARGLEEHARSLAHSTRDIPRPSDSYTMLGELTATLDSLEQVCRQLALWHTRVVDGIQYAGEDERGDGATGTVAAAAALEQAASSLGLASAAVNTAHTANGVVRWYDTPR